MDCNCFKSDCLICVKSGYDVKCKKEHDLVVFKAKTNGKLYWKSNQCSTFYAHAYIEKMAPYDEPNKVVDCKGK